MRSLDPVLERFLRVSAEYAPETQLRILGARADQLLEPILDLGCGVLAPLVVHLRAAGRDAVGVDLATTPQPWARHRDWFAEPLEPQAWGTVLSHMAYSSHFLHEHLRPDGAAERYARRYMEILGALRPGGSFLYAPGLPFFEELLPAAEWTVERRAVAELVDGPADQALAELVGSSVMYAARVTRWTGPRASPKPRVRRSAPARKRGGA